MSSCLIWIRLDWIRLAYTGSDKIKLKGLIRSTKARRCAEFGTDTDQQRSNSSMEGSSRNMRCNKTSIWLNFVEKRL